jgi:hypothetical protein
MTYHSIINQLIGILKDSENQIKCKISVNFETFLRAIYQSLVSGTFLRFLLS